MRILIPVLGFGRTGGNRVLSEMASAWVRSGHTVDFLAPDTCGRPYFPTAAGIIWCDIQGQVSGSDENRQFSARPGRKLMRVLYAGVRRIVDEYDIVLGNHSFTPWIIWLARPRRAKMFYYIQAYEPEYYYLERRPINWLLSRLSYVLPFHQIANSPTYSSHGGMRAEAVVPFGIDLSKFRPKSPLTTLLGSERITIGCIGRSEPAKGTRYVIEAFEKLWAKDKRYRLAAAYGNLPGNWEHEALEIVVPRDDLELAEFYRSLDILVAAGTVQHGAPHYPVLEAMASGVPVVNTGFMPANEQNSWLVRNKDSDSICRQVEAIASDPDLRHKLDRAIGDVQPFAWDAVAARMISIFENHL